MKKVKTRTPPGKIKFHYRRERVQIAKCANCKSQMRGIRRLIPSEFKKLAKSDRRPERPYGGYFCSSCSKEIFRERVRSV